MSFITDEEARGRLLSRQNLLHLSPSSTTPSSSTQINSTSSSTQINSNSNSKNGSHISENTPEVPAENIPASPTSTSSPTSTTSPTSTQKDPFEQLKMAK